MEEGDEGCNEGTAAGSMVWVETQVAAAPAQRHAPTRPPLQE